MSNFDEDFFKDLLREEREECLKGPGIDLDLHEQFVEACQAFQDAKDAKDAAEADLEESTRAGDTAAKAEAQEMLTMWSKALKDSLQSCVDAAKPILEAVDLTEYDLEMSLLRTAILTRATSKGLAKFANDSDLNGQLIETLLNNKKIMKEMILQGGARKNEFGMCMKLYTQIMAGIEKDRFHKVNKKLAMAAALEFCSKQSEFDTSVDVNAQKRFTHYDKAHRKGELDPAFTHFKTWEYRMAINSDAPNEQLKWGRKMQMNFCPHIATIYNEKFRYCYQVSSDVGYRDPTWTSSPRTYQQVLSGGGREGPRAWFGRYICRAFGIPVWGAKQPGNMSMARWTPKGWEFYLGKDGDWDISSWEDRSGVDFYEECRARSAVSEQEYFERVVLLECLADACKEKNKKPEEAGFVNPNKVWRSLALMQRKIFAESCTEDSFQRTGPGVVVSKIEKYIQEIDEQNPPLPIEQDKKGVIVIPASSFTSSSDEKHVRKMKSFGGGSQLHLVGGGGYVTYDIPDEISIEQDKKYMLSAKVCSVHLEQSPLQFEVDGGETFDLEVPYTVGEWGTTEQTEVVIGGMKQLKVFRKSSPTSFGLAIQSFTLTPC
mmetsp:Transcript_16528/g.40395  ORF Transcript_16528/g.40395 Transcript_16528/m.40395 type:complete len:602 (-) Transcript_16528:104-1909(-)